ncbi:MAG: GntR family transcriptional regulator [Lachnospiraceae bacterium]|nr:GntR family transcriptional regulator [Lachnospiraceae bacterium]MCR5001681.1 GntR family transcriptional regulator [Lachnospiraceae bacterium]
MVRYRDRLAGESAKAYALRELNDNIINMELKPGTLISENELSRILGVSRTPIREAIQELVKAQLIEVFPQRGSYVAAISFDAVEEAAFLRRTLEAAIVEELCDCISEDQLRKLYENIDLQGYYLNNGMSDRIMNLDNEFHEMLFLMCGKEQTYRLMHSAMGQFDRMRALSLYSVKEIKIVSDHRNIVDAIKKRDRETARSLMIKHLMRYKLDKEEVIKEYPDYFK